MPTFNNLKNAYISTIQFAMLDGANYNDVKSGNELLNHFCKGMIDGSNYSDIDKPSMKYKLDLLKETLSKEIEEYYKNRS